MSQTHRELSNIIMMPGEMAACGSNSPGSLSEMSPDRHPSKRVKIIHYLANFFRRYSDGRQPIHLVKAFEKTNGD